MNFNLFTFARKVNRPLLLDGAMGSLLQMKGIISKGDLWTSAANFEQPEIVVKIHTDYITAGADIITTNTFRTNPTALGSKSIKKINAGVKQAVNLAKTAKGNKNVLIAGSNAPAEDCYQVARKVSKKELEFNHKLHIDELMKNDCDFILNETQSHFDEIKIICDYCNGQSIPFVLSLLVSENLCLLSGEKINAAQKFVLDRNPLCVGFNCIFPDVFKKIMKHIKLNFNWGMYLNIGIGNYSDEKFTSFLSPSNYSKIVSQYLIHNPSFVGACCGSNPNHIKKLRQMLDGKSNN